MGLGIAAQLGSFFFGIVLPWYGFVHTLRDLALNRCPTIRFINRYRESYQRFFNAFVPGAAIALYVVLFVISIAFYGFRAAIVYGCDKYDGANNVNVITPLCVNFTRVANLTSIDIGSAGDFCVYNLVGVCNKWRSSQMWLIVFGSFLILYGGIIILLQCSYYLERSLIWFRSRVFDVRRRLLPHVHLSCPPLVLERDDFNFLFALQFLMQSVLTAEGFTALSRNTNFILVKQIVHCFGGSAHADIHNSGEFIRKEWKVFSGACAITKKENIEEGLLGHGAEDKAWQAMADVDLGFELEDDVVEEEEEVSHPRRRHRYTREGRDSDL